MFSFFKKRTAKPTTEAEQRQEPVLSPEDISAIHQEIAQLANDAQHSEDNVTLAKLFEKIGLKYKQLGDEDHAINYLEQSLTQKKSIGEGYKSLMNLYNSKRSQAAKTGTMDDIDFWMNKMDEMRNIAKEVTIKRD